MPFNRQEQGDEKDEQDRDDEEDEDCLQQLDATPSSIERNISVPKRRNDSIYWQDV